MAQPKNFQEFIFSLCQYWVNYGCIWSQPYDSQMGAGTFHPHTFFKGLGPEPWRSVYVQPCRRPVDGRYGKSPYRFQHYYQLQVLLKPSPSNIIDVFLQSLEHVGINLKDNDIGLLEDDWKGPTLGAWGLGWEVRANAQEVTQFTYFQQLGGVDIDVVCGEITYGLERLYMYANKIKNGLDIPFNENFTWGDIYYQNENEFSHFNFKEADISQLLNQFNICEDKVTQLCEINLVLPAYDYVLQASHTFNLLDARGAISVSERQRYIGRVRDCAKKCAATFIKSREKLGYPLLNKLNNDARLPILNLQSNKNELDTNNIPAKDIVNPEKDIISPAKAGKNVLNENILDYITFELGVEEMPPSFQQSALSELNQKSNSFLLKQKEIFSKDNSFLNKLNNIEHKVNISSRRISIQYINIPIQEPDQIIEIWGPVERVAKNADGALTQAGLGFCKKNKINPDEVEFKQKPDGSFLFYKKLLPGGILSPKLAQEFKNWIYALSIPLKMKWLDPNISPSFIRPVRSLLALSGEKIIPLEMFGITSSNYIHGQRILSPEKFYLNHAKDYENTLKKLNIDISYENRKAFILKNALEISSKIGGNFVLDENLLNKCAGLFESPYVFHAEFNENYLELPNSLIIGVLKEHMNYFTIYNKDNTKLLPYYIGVANYKCNHIDEMIEGTKNVVTGRLDDGAFYYKTDLETKLEEFRERLKSQTFQENMGTLFDKSERLKQFISLEEKELIPNLVKKLSVNPINFKYNSSLNEENKFCNINKNDFEILQASALYCKADLKTGCVQEFPDEMQGIMGGVLARKQDILKNKEKSELVSFAIEQHYLPHNAQSSLPTSFHGVVLSLMDKLDSLCMMINSGVELKGNKDPFGMRRLGFSIARLLGIKSEANSLNLPVKFCVEFCLTNMNKSKLPLVMLSSDKIIKFLYERISSALKEEYDARVVDAFSEQLIISPLIDIISFIKILDNKIKDQNYSLIESLNPYRRARNITIQFDKSISIQPDLLSAQAEKILYEEVQNKKIKLNNLIETQKYSEIIDELKSIATPLSNFFENVMVNDKEEKIKENRLALLYEVRRLYENIADFSLLQV